MSAVEFALILPVLLILLIGMEEITGAMNYDRKVSRIANSVADLVAQAQTIDKSELEAIMDLGAVILDPYPADTMEIIIASVTFDENGDASIDWSLDNSGEAASGWSKGSEPPITLPDTVAAPETSIVVSQVNLAYEPLFAGVFTQYFSRDSSLDLSDTYYLRPRLTDTVDCSDC
ncbi:TadE/TadG family type IV pilus assembly protein [Roseibium sediminicola]|uniref:Pilus assembly protein n=1 Tax=Roseibium sediminicola TaxID=2933272 RepID=A0ABT0GXA0_9HYPH|nr:pilus assembly protein [Roseibium sp. CAU 1639]